MRFKGAHVPHEIMLLGVRWSAAYLVSYRHVEAHMAEREGAVDHATLPRWVVTYSPPLEAAAHRRQCPVWSSGRLDETSLRVNGEWRALDHAVDP